MKAIGILLVAASFSIASGMHAQSPGGSQAGLRARMAEFLRALPDEGPTEGTRRFFPVTGDWTYTHTVHEASGHDRIQRWTFPAAQTAQLFGFGKNVEVNPIWDSFQADEHGQTEGLLIAEVGVRPWRLVGRTRFVPPGEPASSAVFVEWRREHGLWVISAFGDERFCEPPRLGYQMGDIVRTRSAPERTPPVYAANEGWYTGNQDLRYDQQRYSKYGQPREIQITDLEPFGWKEEVRVYVEKGHARLPIVLYVPTAPGVYQPYQAFGSGRDPYCPR